VSRVVRTNLTGSLLVTRAAMRAMAAQPGGGHIFNTEGAGSDGNATPKVRGSLSWNLAGRGGCL
jgi:chlorophyll(ide) b reductase